MDKYTYILISFFLIFPWSLIFRFKKSLRTKILKTSIIGGFSGLLAELWYSVDYWQPPTIYKFSITSIEDFLFGFLITGIAANCFDIFDDREIAKDRKNRKNSLLGLFFLGLSTLLIFNNILSINSIFVTSFTFNIISIIILIYRKDLIIRAIISGIVILLTIIPIYAIIFNLITSNYWEQYWLLANTKYGVTILGNIPLTELLWYFSWGSLASIIYDYGTGVKKAQSVYES